MNTERVQNNPDRLGPKNGDQKQICSILFLPHILDGIFKNRIQTSAFRGWWLMELPL
jgi:hypothetical protein